MSTRTLTGIGVIAIAIVFAVITLTGGEDDEAQASETDGAFITAMVPHHESAIEMAMMAEERAQHPEIETLAREIIDAQSAEIKTLNQIHERLYGEPAGAAHGSLGLPEEMMGMDMDMAALQRAKPFDRAFIDAMIAHHQGAVRMAQVELAEGDDDETKSLASAIIDAQALEIGRLNEWRTDWYGSPSPAGGVPEESETMEMMDQESGSMPGMDH